MEQSRPFPNTGLDQGAEYISAPTQPLVTTMDAWWWANADLPEKLPRRSDFRPEAMPRALPNIWLMDVIEEERGLAYRTRLWGTGCTRATGIDRTGVETGEDPTRFANTAIPKWQRAYRRLYEIRRPVYFRNRLFEYNREFIMGEVGIFPLSRDNSNQVSMILGIFDLIQT